MNELKAAVCEARHTAHQINAGTNCCKWCGANKSELIADNRTFHEVQVLRGSLCVFKYEHGHITQVKFNKKP